MIENETGDFSPETANEQKPWYMLPSSGVFQTDS